MTWKVLLSWYIFFYNEEIDMKILLISFSIGMLVLLSGCTQLDSGGIDDIFEEIITSLTEIRVGDMPTEEFTSVNITFSEIKLFSPTTGWVNFSYEPTTIDLLYLHLNNLTEQLGVNHIAIANYTKLWILIENATGTLKQTGEQIIFDVPSNTLKIQHLFDIRQGNNSITIDIDLDSSILSVGQGYSYKILPVIGALRVQYANGTQIHIRDHQRIRNMTQNRPPTVELIVNGQRGKKPLTVTIDENISFDASETIDIDGDDLSYSWDFGDGTSSIGSIVTHQYTVIGSYWVTLTVSDGELETIQQIHIIVRQQNSHGQS